QQSDSPRLPAGQAPVRTGLLPRLPARGGDRRGARPGGRPRRDRRVVPRGGWVAAVYGGGGQAALLRAYQAGGARGLAVPRRGVPGPLWGGGRRVYRRDEPGGGQ